MKIIPFVLCAVSCLAGAQQVSAATIAKGGDALMGCTATLSGVISAGDAERLRALQRSEDWGNDYYGGKDRLCLDSPGGSYPEALLMSEMLNEAGIGTAVAAGKHCESACAIVFMGGKRNGEAKNYWSDRVLHPQGRLGFHAPALAIGEGNYNKDDVDRAYAIALQSIGSLQSLKLIRGYDFPDTLVVEMLNVPPDGMRHIETVGDAAQWNIEVAPTVLPGPINAEMAENACLNASAMEFGYMAGDGFLPDPLFKTVYSNNGAHYFRSNGGFLVEGAWDCVVRIEDSETDFPVGDRRLRWSAEFDAGSPEFLQRQTLWPFMLYPPSTRLVDLP